MFQIFNLLFISKLLKKISIIFNFFEKISYWWNFSLEKVSSFNNAELFYHDFMNNVYLLIDTHFWNGQFFESILFSFKAIMIIKKHFQVLIVSYSSFSCSRLNFFYRGLRITRCLETLLLQYLKNQRVKSWKIIIQLIYKIILVFCNLISAFQRSILNKFRVILWVK